MTLLNSLKKTYNDTKKVIGKGINQTRFNSEESNTQTTQKPLATGKLSVKKVRSKPPSKTVNLFSLPESFVLKEPTPLEESLLPVMAFDYSLLPTKLRDFVRDNAYRMNNNEPDYIAVAIMISMAGLLGARVQVQPKQLDTDWQEVPTLWGSFVGDPSRMKSPSLSIGLSLLSSVQKGFDDVYLQEAIEFSSQQELDELKKKRFLKEKSDAFFKRKISDEEMASALATLKADQLTPPKKRNVVINDTTYEALSIRLESNPYGVLMVKDEISGWLTEMFLEKNATANAFYLASFSASKMTFSQERVGRENIELPRIVMSLLGGIQPAMLIPFLQKRKNDEKNDGLFERLQFQVFPDKYPFKLVDQAPDKKAQEDARSVFQRLAQIEPAQQGQAITYKFSQDAQLFFDERLKDNAWKVSKAILSKDNGLVSILGKQDTLLAKLALLLHIADEPENLLISMEATQQAYFWQEYLWTHSQRIHALVNSSNKEAYALLAKMDKLKNPFTASDFKSKGWSNLSTSDERIKALSILVNNGYLHKNIHQNARGGRPVEKYHKHPCLIT